MLIIHILKRSVTLIQNTKMILMVSTRK